MSKYEIHQTNSTTKSYSSESNNEFEESIDDRNTPSIIEDNNIIMKTPQSLDDLLDVDDNDHSNEESKEETENEDDDDDDDDQYN